MIQLRTALQRRPLVTALLLGLGLNPLVSSAVTQTASLDNGDLAGARACMRRQASVSMSSSRVSGDCSITGAVGSKDGLGRGNAVAGAPGAAALPAGCRIVSGSGSVTSAGQTLTISQSSAVLMIDCSSFRVGANASVIVEQRQGSESIVVVRISDQTPSEILGAISANGRVFLIHPNGILFGASARVRASGLVASSLNIGDADVIADKLTFGDSGNPAAVRNRGSITTPARGQVYLIAARVENTGVIGSPQGDVLLAAGRNVRLTRGGDLKAHVVVSAPTDMAWNLGSIVAQGGKIGIYGALVDQRGLVMVDSAAAGEKGDVVLKAARTTALAGGSQTTAVGADTGGTIALLGANVELVDAADVDASGRTGGGAVWIGGGFHGADAALDDATTTYVGANARVHADALQTGNGGRVAVWSNQRTAMYAKISARGGASGGNGGYVETSSRNSLGVGGSVDLTASRGTTGDLLLDPYTITIDDVGSAPISPTGTNPVSYTSSADSDVTAASINALLTSANVIVQTGASGGSITVTSNNLNWNTGNTLTLAASADVNIDGSILGQTGNLELIATGGNITQTAPVVVGSLSAKAGGDVTLTDPGNIVGTLAGSSGGTNGFRFSTNDNITVGTVTGNAATVTGISATGSGGVVLDAGGSVSTASATVSGPSLSIVSQSGVGSIFNPLATSVSSLTITNGSAFGGGDIAVSNTGGALTLPSITQTSSG
ncbi:MAG TPA: filamentous hemagglutinin N-terminal domain-containing protein, partial [Rudaea sp.]|nr:filamentous hemagglutinin N-terminal domain-containing protein [Rudaea sp.]